MFKNIFTLVIAIFAVMYVSEAGKTEEIMQDVKAAYGFTEGKEITSAEMTIDVSRSGMNQNMKYYFEEPEKFRMETSAMGQDIVMVYNGVEGWIKAQGAVQAMPDQALPQLQMYKSAIEDPFSEYSKEGAEIKVKGKEVIDGTECWKLAATTADGNQSTIYVDDETNLLVQVVSDQNGQEITQDIEEHMTVGEFKIASKINISTPQGSMSIEIKNAKINEDVDDSLFTKPQ